METELLPEDSLFCTEEMPDTTSTWMDPIPKERAVPVHPGYSLIRIAGNGSLGEVRHYYECVQEVLRSESAMEYGKRAVSDTLTPEEADLVARDPLELSRAIALATGVSLIPHFGELCYLYWTLLAIENPGKYIGEASLNNGKLNTGMVLYNACYLMTESMRTTDVSSFCKMCYSHIKKVLESTPCQEWEIADERQILHESSLVVMLKNVRNRDILATLCNLSIDLGLYGIYGFLRDQYTHEIEHPASDDLLCTT